jgi:hypothetical protein
MFGDQDLGVFFADFGVSVTGVGAQPVQANFDAPGQAIDLHSGAPVSGVDYAITYSTLSMTLSARQVINITGAGNYSGKYRVNGIDPLDDGLITKATLGFISQ